MLDLSTITALQIPEGNVAQVERQGCVVWSANRWDIELDCTTSAPASTEWDYPIGTGKSFWESDYGGGLRLYSSTSETNSAAGLRYKDYLSLMGEHTVFEVDFTVSEGYRNTGGVRFMLGGSSNGIASGKGICVAINKNTSDNKTYLNVLESSDAITAQKKTCVFELTKQHTIKLELNTIEQNNCVYFNGELISTQNNSQLSTQAGKHWWINVLKGNAWIHRIRYRKIS